jgi:hypothetical protein
MSDGKHFVSALGPQPSIATPCNIVLSWFEELKEKTLAR